LFAFQIASNPDQLWGVDAGWYKPIRYLQETIGSWPTIGLAVALGVFFVLDGIRSRAKKTGSSVDS
jgi:hypothetical protein